MNVNIELWTDGNKHYTRETRDGQESISITAIEDEERFSWEVEWMSRFSSLEVIG
jgi:hypothetical protein